MSFVNRALARAPWRWYAVSALVVILDLTTKKWISATFGLYERYNVVPFFDLTLRHNPGAAFSFLADQGGWQIWFFSILSAIVSVVLVVWIARVASKHFWETLGLALVLGGALGNLYDRVTLGYVVDFILVYYEEYQFPAFNIADSAISVGAAILIIDTLFIRKPAEEKDQAGERDGRTVDR